MVETALGGTVAAAGEAWRPPDNVSHDDGLTVDRYLRAFLPAPSWQDLFDWPPDAFALTNLLLDHSEAYRFAVAPPAGTRWPPTPDWNEQVLRAARRWRTTAGRCGAPLPADVAGLRDVVAGAGDTPMGRLRDGSRWDLCQALLTLHAMADEACAGVSGSPWAGTTPFEERAWSLLGGRCSLSRLPAARVRVTPKTHFVPRGITIRSFSRYLALSYESVDLRWRRVQTALRQPIELPATAEYDLVLLPWPLEVRADDFRAVEGPIDNMDPAFGFFEFAPRRPFDLDLADRVLREAKQHGRAPDGVVLPEGAIRTDEIPALQEVLYAHEVGVLIAGVRQPARGPGFGRNYLHVGVYTGQGWEVFEQSKHHRWCLDGPQIRQYHLSRSLDPSKQWWEAIDLPHRTLEVIDVGGGATTAPLVCEDLGRVDEVSDLLRRIGPTLVVAALLDGPQLASRWSSRYACVLADDPGSAVLTLTSAGMVARSRPAGLPPSRVVALWKDPTAGLHEIALGRGASGVLVRATVQTKTAWSADGRCHRDSTPDLAFAGVRQLRPRRAG